MICLSAASLVGGWLLAQHFRSIVLAPATFVVVVVSIAVGVAHTVSVWSIILTIAAESVGIQIGYFFGILTHYVLGALLACRSAVMSSGQGAGRPIEGLGRSAKFFQATAKQVGLSSFGQRDLTG
jgi:hypothetical protein